MFIFDTSNSKHYYMRLHLFSILMLLFLLNSSSIAQGAYNYMDEREDTTRFFIGANLGAFFANKNTANVYSGSPDVTQFNISTILNNQFFKPTFDQFFGPSLYKVEEYPFNPKYRPAFEIGLHAGYNINKRLALFLDFNIAQLDVEQFFTIGIDDPTNGLVGPTLEQYALFGEENRLNLNIGTQFNFHESATSKAYVSVFFNMNDVDMRRNYIVIDETQYEIFHINNEQPDLRLGGIGYGGGAGLGYRFHVSQNVLADIYYNLIYTRTNLSEQFQPYGAQHSLGIRVLLAK